MIEDKMWPLATVGEGLYFAIYEMHGDFKREKRSVAARRCYTVIPFLISL